MSESILLTGNRGFIGSRISSLLEADGIDLKDGLDIVTYRAEKKYDVVIHTAAKISVTESMTVPEEYIRTNIIGTLNMVKQHPEAHFIYLSTAGVYGEGINHTVNSLTKPNSIYTSTKLMGEYIIQNLAKSWCVLRLTNVIGEGERGELNVYQIFQKSKILNIYGDGLQTRDFIHVDKVCEAVLQSFKRTGIYNVGSGVSKTILEVAREFDKPILYFPARPGEIKKFGIADAINYSS